MVVEINELQHVATLFVLVIIGEIIDKVDLYEVVNENSKHFSSVFKELHILEMVIVQEIPIMGILQNDCIVIDLIIDELQNVEVVVIKVVKIYYDDFLIKIKEDLTANEIEVVKGIVIVYLNNMDSVMVIKMSII